MLEASPRLAILIDADNFPPWAVERLLNEVEKLGRPIIRRIYGNIATNSKRWTTLSARFGLVSRQQFAHSVGKNATDIAMVIDAMDLLAHDEADGFCLVSSDGDFTALALRLREGNRLVFGFGEAKAPEHFRTACDRYFTVVFKQDKQSGGQVIAFPRPAIERALPHILAAVKVNSGGDGWAFLSRVNEHLLESIPGFNVKDYGVKTVNDLVTKTRGFEIGMAKGGVFRVREKPQRTKRAVVPK